MIGPGPPRPPSFLFLLLLLSRLFGVVFCFVAFSRVAVGADVGAGLLVARHSSLSFAGKKLSVAHFPSSVSSTAAAAAAMAATASVQEAPTSTEIDQLTRIRLELATLDQIR